MSRNRTECDFRSQIPYGGSVRVSVRVPEMPRAGGKSWVFEYRLDDGGDESSPPYAEARTVQVMFDYEAQETTSVPDDVRRRFAEIDGLEGTQ